MAPTNVDNTHPTAEVTARLQSEHNVWMATVRPDGRTHLVPIWFTWVNDRFWICTGTASVKVRNLRANDSISIALESGNSPVIAEGRAVFVESPPADVADEFLRKYQWDISGDREYGALFSVAPSKWIRWTA